MSKLKGAMRGLSLTFAFLLTLFITASIIMEQYSASLDENLGTTSSKVVVDSDSDDWVYESEFKSAKDAVETMREFAIEEQIESTVLLKNENDALPLSSNPKVSMFGIRSYAPFYGSNGGSIPDKAIIDDGNRIYETFDEENIDINPTLFAAYESYFSDKTWGTSGYGAVPPDYDGITNDTTDPHELSPSDLASISSSYNSSYTSYNDAAIVMFGRPGGESNEYLPGEEGLADGVETTTGNILSLSTEEQAILKEATDNFETVIVLINAANAMDVAEIEENEDVDAILWIGGPGPYGFHGVAQVLKGEANPSGHLGDIYAKNNALAPAMQSMGNIPWEDADSYTGDENVNSYLIEAEGIYSGYRYYETRYADTVDNSNVSNNAATASAGTYANADGTVATSAGTWDYSNEVVYPFGYGGSYTTFEQTLDKVEFSDDMQTAYVTVTTTNTGDVAGKEVVQVYAQSPYTTYDKTNGVEKSAIQLMDFEKTDELAANGGSQTITLNVDMANLASYDYTNAQTFIMDISDEYYFAIGDDSHDALNNVLAAQGFDTEDGMDYDGDASKVEQFSWSGSGTVDTTSFSTSDNGTAITNQLSDGIYSMDYNSFQANTVTYLTRNNWDGTFPESYEGFSSTSEMEDLLGCDFIDLETNETSDVTFGDTESELTFNDMRDVEFDDEKWDELVSKISIAEILDFMSSAFHNIEGIDSIGFAGYSADDGPGGSDSYSFSSSAGAYRGEIYEDATDYEGYGTRIGPTQTNLAYTWNKDMAYRNGELVLGESTLMFNLPIMIGPGMNIHRHNYNGRGVEYFSEDPILSGFIGSAVVQGAQSKGCLVNVKHAAFNDQEINRSGIAVFMNEQKARELELRNLEQAFEAKGRPADFATPDGVEDNSYGTEGALGVMTSYNRVGAVPSSANSALTVEILRNEWGFVGYNVTDFTSVALKASPKESILAGTTAFCGFSITVDYWSASSLQGDADMCQALHDDMHYALYALSRSYAMDLSINTETVSLISWWRGLYIGAIAGASVLLAASIVTYVVCNILDNKKKRS